MIFYYEIDRFVDVFYKLKKILIYYCMVINIINFRYGYIVVGLI